MTWLGKTIDQRFEEAKYLDLFLQTRSDAARDVFLRGFTKDGIFQHVHTTNADRTEVSTSVRLSDFPTLVQVYPVTRDNIRRGSLYALVTLRLGGFAVGQLCAGYIGGSMKSLTFPPGIHEDSNEGPGLLRSVLGTNPAANAEISETVPTDALWRIHSLEIQLVTDANVATRTSFVIVDDGTNRLHELSPGATQAASLTRTYNYLNNYNLSETAFDGDGFIRRPFLKDNKLPGGYRVRTNTSSIQAGDNYAAPRIFVEEWIMD